MILAVAAITDEDLHQAALTIYGEARGEPVLGKIAVAWVIRNRVTWTPAAWWGTTVTQVCLHPYQFACRSENDPNAAVLAKLSTSDLFYQMCFGVAKGVLLQTPETPDPTFGATTYKLAGTVASWDKAVAGFVPVIVDPKSKHVFWRLSPQGECLPFLNPGDPHV